MENMAYWNKLKKPPATALKAIQAGRLKGKTDINPQWRMQAMTEAFGPAGIGWTYSIDKLWTEQGVDGIVFAFALVSVKVKADDVWSEPVPGIGGNMIIQKESSGLHCNDEGYKMAVTDAISVALKSFGVAADIYMGMWDGSKYKTEASDEKPPKEKPPQEKPQKEKPDHAIWGLLRTAYTDHRKHFDKACAELKLKPEHIIAVAIAEDVYRRVNEYIDKEAA